jgi:hypothetical protein
MGLNIICRRLNLDPDQILNLGRENGGKIPQRLEDLNQDSTERVFSARQAGRSEEDLRFPSILPRHP